MSTYVDGDISESIFDHDMSDKPLIEMPSGKLNMTSLQIAQHTIISEVGYYIMILGAKVQSAVQRYVEALDQDAIRQLNADFANDYESMSEHLLTLIQEI